MDMAVAVLLPSLKAKTVSNALQNQGRSININRSDWFLSSANDVLNIKVVTWNSCNKILGI